MYFILMKGNTATRGLVKGIGYQTGRFVRRRERTVHICGGELGNKSKRIFSKQNSVVVGKEGKIEHILNSILFEVAGAFLRKHASLKIFNSFNG